MELDQYLAAYCNFSAVLLMIVLFVYVKYEMKHEGNIRKRSKFASTNRRVGNATNRRMKFSRAGCGDQASPDNE